LQGEIYSFDSSTVELVKEEFENRRIELFTNEDVNYIRFLVNGKQKVCLIEIIDKRQPDFIAEVDYQWTEDGGKINYVMSGYRPHFQIAVKPDMTSAEQLFVDKTKVFPGESVTAEIRILGLLTFKGLLYPGLAFNLSEGSRIIGNGLIKEVFNQKLLRNGY